MILFLDTATISTGWALGSGARCAVGALQMPGLKNRGLMLASLQDGLNALYAQQPFTIIGYESPVKSPKDSLHKIRGLYALGPFIEWWGHRKGLTVFEAGHQALKKELTGSAKATKADMVAAASKAVRLPAIGTEDAADAFAGWLLALRKYSPADRAYWDKIIWGPRGALKL